MSLMNVIRQKQLEARKAHDPMASIYTTLLGEASIIGKNAGNRETTDSETTAVIKKFIKNNDETIAHIKESNPSGLDGLLKENACLAALLPTQLDERGLRIIINQLKLDVGSAQKDMGKIMGRLKADFDGQYDGRLASALVKEMLE